MLFFLMSVLLFLGAMYHVLILARPGFYPPKPLLKKRVAMLALGCLITFFLGMILFSFQS